MESLNARPLTWGFEKKSEHTIFRDSPKNLAERLLSGELDTALISSVECIRRRDTLGYSISCGVCARTSVRSILYFRNKKYPKHDTVFVDSGSKTSVALLEILLELEQNLKVKTIPRPASWIQAEIQSGRNSHLLFGDNALRANWDPDQYEILDLAEWWNRLTGQFFIFALWAFPKEFPIDDRVFLQSLEFGLQNIPAIVEQENEFPKKFCLDYLTRELHYIPEDKNLTGFKLFEDYLWKFNRI